MWLLQNAFLFLPHAVKSTCLELQIVRKKQWSIISSSPARVRLFPKAYFLVIFFCLPLEDTSNSLHFFHKKTNRHQQGDIFFPLKGAKCLPFFPDSILLLLSAALYYCYYSVLLLQSLTISLLPEALNLNLGLSFSWQISTNLKYL